MGVPRFLLPATLGSLALLTSAVPFLRVDAQESAPVTNSAQQCPPQNILVPQNVAVIVNTGSTNTPCYRIYVSPTGEASYVEANKRGSGKIPVRLTKRFFRDIKAAEPLSSLPTKSCVKPVSFATSTFIRLGAEESPDVSCPGNAKAAALFQDATAIARDLKLTK